MINSQAPNNKKKFDLEKRTLKFAKKIIRPCKELSKNTVNFRLTDQIIRSASSIGTNYREANETDTKKDFKKRRTLGG